MLAGVVTLRQFGRKKQRTHGAFKGTDSPRGTRLLREVLRRHITREEADAITGASNSPEEVRKLREMGLDLPCFAVGTVDRDGRNVERGVYGLSPRDRPLVAKALYKGKGGPAATQSTASDDEATTGGQPDE
jgi:hypothetical protein